MKKELVNIRKIKDWFIIQRIRTLNFIKEHKFLSVGVAVFLMSCIAFLIVYATDTNFLTVYDYKFETKNSSGEKITTENVKSFDTVSFNIWDFDFTEDESPSDEILSNLKVLAEIESVNDSTEEVKNLDAYWTSYNMQMEYVQKTEGEDKSKATYIITNTTFASSHNIYLKLNNIKNETKVKVKITINDNAVKYSEFIVNSEEVDLVPMISSGTPYKYNDGETSGRYMPFGISLGINLDKEQTLKGKYFNPDVELTITSTHELLIGEENTDYFGFYDSSKGLLDAPHYKYNLNYNKFVYNSGDSVSIIEDDNNSTKEFDYVMNVKGITTDDIYFEEYSQVKLSSLFITAKSPREEGNNDDIKTFVTIKSKNSNLMSSIWKVNQAVSPGTKSNIITINKETSNGLKVMEDAYLAYGEEAVLSSVFTYSKDGDENITFQNVIPVGNAYLDTNDIYDEATVPFEMIEYSDDLPYYVKINDSDPITEQNDRIDVKYGYACVEDNESCVNGIIWEDSYKSSNVLYIKYKINNIEPGSKIDFRIKVKAGKGHQSGTSIVTVESFKDIGEYHATTDLQTNISASIGLKIFKIEANILIDEKIDNIVIDGSNTNKSTMAIYPYISLPEQKINTNAAELSEIESFNVLVMLPDGLKFIPNSNYIIPEEKEISINIPSINIPCITLPGFSLPCINTPPINISGKFLSYSISPSNAINDWIDPIYLDFTYDPSIETGTEINIQVFIEAVFADDDDENVDDAVSFNKTITYLNTEEIAYNQTVSKTNIEKDSSFDVSIEVINRTSVDKSFNIITLLPPNTNELTYNGSYELEGVLAGSLCSKSIMNQEKFEDDTFWEDCSSILDNDYSEITAIKVPIESLTPGVKKSIQYKINVLDNEADDKYNFKSFLIKDGSVKEIGQNIVTVFSKKITGVIWEDFDGNGIKDINEQTIEGIELALIDENDDIVMTKDETEQSAISDEDGKYSFVDLDDGNYRVIAIYDATKYGLSPKRDDIYDKSIKTSFSAFSFDLFETQELAEEEFEENGTEDCGDDECLEDEETPVSFAVAVSDEILITEDSKTINNINLGLSLQQIYTIKMNKYITKAVMTNALGIATTKDFGNVTFAKLDVKDINNLTIKVVYTIELENTGFYPGYIYSVKDFIPAGMSFNESYEENKGWFLKDSRYLENNSLSDELIKAGEKKYLTIAFDIASKEAGTFINYAVVDDEDLQILAGSGEGGNSDE